MKTIVNTIPGYRVYEYLLVLHPHQELVNKIMKIKEQFAADYQADWVRWSKPHVTLVNFVQYAMLEDRLMNRLEAIAMGVTPFKVELKDYASFPSHTIYIAILSKPSVQGLMKHIRTEAQQLMKLNNDHKPHFIMEPHLTIARKLKPWQYEKAWLEYGQKHFSGRFIADGMTLLRREVNTTKYQTIKRFSFQNMPVAIRQGELFG